MELKEKLKKARSERKISQQALADAIFVSRSAVAKWESGLGVPCAESMEALEKYFGVESGYFMTDKPDEVIVKKNIRMRAIIFSAVAGVFLFALLTVGIIHNRNNDYGPTLDVAKGTKIYVYTTELNTDYGSLQCHYQLYLFNNGSFMYIPGLHSSYIYDGEWKMDGDEIILTNFDEKKYTLKISKNNTLVFDASRSDGKFNVSDGAVFVKTRSE